MMRRIVVCLSSTFVVIVLFGTACFGQFTNPTVDQIPPVAGAGHDYIHFLNETVSPATGAVNIRICVPAPSGRGLSLPFCFAYDSNSAHHDSGYYTSNTSYLAGGGWSYIVPTLTATSQNAQSGNPAPTTCVWWTNFIFQDMQGTIHALGLVTPPTNPHSGCATPSQVLTAGDANVRATTPATYPSSPATPPVTITTVDGTVYYFSNSPSEGNGQGGNVSLPTWIEDRNGNKIVFSDQGGGVVTGTDTLGRSVVQINGFGASGNTVAVSGLSNPYSVTWSPQSFSWTYNFQKFVPPSNLDPKPLCYVGPAQSPTTATGTMNEITRITLPNSQFYQFQYDQQSGLISKIIYPDGAYIRYVWANSHLANSQVSASTNYQGLDGCEALYDSPAIQSRFVSFDGKSEVQEQDFSYNTNWIDVAGQSGTFKQWNTKNTTVVTKDLAHSVGFQLIYNYAPLAVASYPGYLVPAQTDTGVYPVNPAESSILTYDVAPNGSTGTLLKVVTKTFADYWAPPTDEKDTLDNGQTSEVKNGYMNGGFGGSILIDQWTYDFGAATGAVSNPAAPGALLRHAHADYNNFSTPIGGAILDRPSDVLTYDGNGNEVAETDYCYDGATSFSGCLSSSLVAVSATGHDDTNFGASGPGSGYNRGNVTSVVHKCFVGSTTTACAQGGTIVTNYQYDQTGQEVSKTDPNGNVTSYSYADNFDIAPPGTNAYLTKITDALNHTESFQYAYADGQLIQTTGLNGEQTGYQYADPLRRLTETDFPSGGGKTLLTYNEATYPPSVVTQKQLDSSRYVKSTAVMDGQGHVTEVQLNSDPQVIKTDTTFDYLGRGATVTNPFRSTTDSTYGSTTTKYDGLGRVTKITKQDGSVVTTSYTGNRTTITDEAGNQRRTTTDALGRLIRVDEPGDSYTSSPSLATLTPSGSILSQSGVGSTPSTYATGWVTMQGTDSFSSTYGWDSGYIQFQANGCSAKTGYSQTSTLSGLAAGLISAINSTPSCQVTASPSPNDSTTVKLTSSVAGAAGNFAFSANSVSGLPANISSFPPFTSGATLTGGQDGNPGSTVYDSGTITVTIGSWTSAGIPYGQSSNNTPLQIASALLPVLNSSSSPVTAVVWGGDISLVDKTTGAAANGTAVTIHSNSAYPSLFANGSFSGSATLSGGGTAVSSSLNIPYVTLYKYDTLGNLLCVEQHGDTGGTGCSSYPNLAANDPWHTRMFIYNSLSELLAAYNPEAGAATYAYDKDGNLINKTTPEPNQTGTATTTFTYCYDALNRLLARGSVNSPSSPQQCTGASMPNPIAAYGYDSGTNGIGHQTAMVDGSGAIIWGYDSMGRVNALLRQTNPGTGFNAVTKGILYSYNLMGGITSITYPSGTVVNYSQDDAGRDRSVTDITNNINYVAGAAYSPDGKIGSFTSGTNGAMTSAYVYNPRQQICRELVSTTGILPTTCSMPGSVGAGNIVDFNYDFHLGNGDNGNLYVATNNKDTTRNQNYTYDTLNRLLTAQTSGSDCSVKLPGSSTQTKYWGEGFTYDAWGNLTAKTTTMCTAENQPLAVDTTKNKNQLASYVYDAAGNTIGNGSVTISYDADSQLIYALGYHYGYDGAGNRVEKSNGSTGTIYWRGAGGVLTETDLLGNPQSDYIFFNGQRVARRDLSTANSPVYYYFGNQINSASVITDASGNIKDEDDYYPWGGLLSYSSNVSNHYWFTGKERDAETQLDYFGARYYGNALGRFITPDWSAKAEGVPYADFTDPQSLNLYGYVRDNPITRVDPDGHCDNDCPRITVRAEAQKPQMTKESKGAKDTAEVVARITYTLKSNGSPLANTQVQEQVHATTTRNGTKINPSSKTGPGSTDAAGKVTDTTSIGATTNARPPFANAAVGELTGNVFTKNVTQVLTFQSPSGCTCQVTEQRTLTNADASGHASTNYNLNLNSPETQTAVPAAKTVKHPDAPDRGNVWGAHPRANDPEGSHY